MRRFPFVLLPLAACAPPGDTVLDVTYDVCRPIGVLPPEDATDDELASIDDALALWNATGITRLHRVTDGSNDNAIAIRFEDAAPMFFGYYDDEAGVVLINRAVGDRGERTVVLAHELGHAFGLFHISSGDRISVMNKGNRENGPTAEDALAILDIWGPCSDQPPGSP